MKKLKPRKKKGVIWSNYSLDLKDWQDFFREEYPDVTNENKQYALMVEMNDQYLDDAQTNLDIHVAAPEIIVIADIGRWDGRRFGYKLIPSGRIRHCLSDPDCDYCEWYVDTLNDLRFTGAHHDGQNYYLYREFKPGLSETQKENFLNKIRNSNGTLSRRDITRYTLPIGPYIDKVYGWV